MTTPNPRRVDGYVQAPWQQLTNIIDLVTRKRLTQAEALKRVQDAKDWVARKAMGVLSLDWEVTTDWLEDILSSVRRVLAGGGKND